MSWEDTIGYQNEEPTCAVCGKGVEHERGFVRVNHKGTMIDLCCPLCLETFQKDPEPYMHRLATIRDYRALRGIKPKSGE